MAESNTFYPSEENLGRRCSSWREMGGTAMCGFPKAELEGRESCLGVIDDVCLYFKNHREPSDITKLLLLGSKFGPVDPKLLPPGQIE